MSWLQTFVLAIIQGLTEFLPVSSSAHLILPSQLLGWEDQGLAFDVAVHIGTLFAVIWYYRHKLMDMTRGALSGARTRTINPDLRLALLIAWATLPAVVVGFLGKDLIAEHTRSVAVIASSTLVFGVLLWVSDVIGRREMTLMGIGLGVATLVGLAQMLALIPGTSRSGVTITAALLLGLRRDDAANLSFLMSIPLILGAIVLMSFDLAQAEQIFTLAQLLVASVVAGVVAYLTIGFFIALVTRLGMLPFVIYRLALGLLLVAFFL
ncbi:undecaprenyl-diphosphate phosphatase [Alcanivorax sp. JB21]|uniref:undecaprenyl-diphosphate phosphatase n=1 Tax=Alcanivorax limicola TaxID=2874102 RepID=UPI001CC112D4|nr:undecaprenyl-diphosphate phosphatase [Alcanivorax limicola]MBZ2189866.1 undecaprenyl-diphosphate phosphatase [Alcanivorax limicola]